MRRCCLGLPHTRMKKIEERSFDSLRDHPDRVAKPLAQDDNVRQRRKARHAPLRKGR